MKAIILTVAAVLTAGTAMAQTPPAPGGAPFTTHETEDSIMMISPDGCMIRSKIVNQLVVAVADGSTVVFSDRSTVVIQSDGKFTAVNSPYPGDEARRILTMIANNAQRVCADAIKTIGR
jgi:hypothetical protein